MEGKAPHAVVFGLALVFGLTACSSTPPRPNHASGLTGSTPSAETVAARAAFRAAMVRVRDDDSVPADPPALRAYAIYPYLIAARLRAALSRPPVAAAAPTPDASIETFLQEQRGEPVTRELAHDWLLSLAKRREWPTFLAHVSDFAGTMDDPVLVCATFSARLATRDDSRRGVSREWCGKR